jgi:hypothetical protein
MRKKWEDRLTFPAIQFNVAISVLFHLNKIEGTLLVLATYNYATGAWLVLGAILDVAISTLLIVVLRKRIEDTFFDQTYSLLRRLISLAIMSASYTSLLAAIAAIIAYGALSRSLPVY